MANGLPMQEIDKVASKILVLAMEMGNIHTGGLLSSAHKSKLERRYQLYKLAMLRRIPTLNVQNWHSRFEELW